MTTPKTFAQAVISTAAELGSKAATPRGAAKFLAKRRRTTWRSRMPAAATRPDPRTALVLARDIMTLAASAKPGRYSRTNTTWRVHDKPTTLSYTPNTGGPGRVGTPAHLTIRLESHVQIAVGGRSVAGKFNGRAFAGQAPAGAYFRAQCGYLEVCPFGARRGASVHVEDLILGLYDGTGVLMPIDLAPEFGAVEFGPRVAARAEIARKRAIVRARRAESRAAIRDARAVRLLARISQAPARLADARAVGHCLPGIEAWARARGVALDASVPLSTLARDTDARAWRVSWSVARTIWAAR